MPMSELDPTLALGFLLLDAGAPSLLSNLDNESRIAARCSVAVVKRRSSNLDTESRIAAPDARAPSLLTWVAHMLKLR